MYLGTQDVAWWEHALLAALDEIAVGGLGYLLKVLLIQIKCRKEHPVSY